MALSRQTLVTALHSTGFLHRLTGLCFSEGIPYSTFVTICQHSQSLARVLLGGMRFYLHSWGCVMSFFMSWASMQYGYARNHGIPAPDCALVALHLWHAVTLHGMESTLRATYLQFHFLYFPNSSLLACKGL